MPADGGRTIGTERREARADPDAERAVLAAMLLDEDGAEAVIPRVRAIVRDSSAFYEPRHAVIFDALCALSDRRERVDVITVVAELRARERLNAVGGAQYVGEITDFLPTIAHCEAHARIVAEEARARRTRDEALRAARDIDCGERDLSGVAARVAEAAADFSDMGDLAPIDEALDAEEARLLGGGAAGTVSTGLAPLDVALCGGFGVADFVVIAAGTSVGKSCLALQIADAVASRGDLALYFSLEMPKATLAQRLACQRSGLDLGRVRAGTIDATELGTYTRALGEARGLPMRVSDKRGLRPSQIRARCLAAKARAGSLGVVVIDYLQLLSADADSESRAREVGSISHALQALPGELGCPVIAICTLNRKADDREGAPKLGDLRESGDIGYDADAVLFIWREGGDRTMPTLTVAKQRNGPPCEKIPLAWDASGIRLRDPTAERPEARPGPVRTASHYGANPHLRDGDDASGYDDVG